MKVAIFTADQTHFKYAAEIAEMMCESSKEKGTNLARRTPEYIKEKMENHKAIIACLPDGTLAGFSYIETWSHTRFVANSGLIVAPRFRNSGLARQIKQKIFELSRQMYPFAKIFSITTGIAVMKINYELGFRPVTFSELTQEQEFWDGCKGCRNYDVLKRNNFKICLCTALLYDPSEHETKTRERKSLKQKIKALLK
ncbi:MAG: GNAT family N-acetyltransferase [Bacteroidales bacterium]|nr:GNAT family N-acetyltransferase [Bacteroidales bacterium]